MRITHEQRRYLECLSKGMTLKQMAPELGWTYRQVLDFGGRFFGRDFEERRKEDPVLGQLEQECRRYWTLVMRACKMPGAEDLIRLYEETGDDKYRFAFTHMLLERVIDKLGIRAELEESRRKPN
jgi:hypothetical protein